MGCGRSCCLGQLVGGGSRGWHGGTAAQGVQAVLHERLAASADPLPPPPRRAPVASRQPSRRRALEGLPRRHRPPATAEVKFAALALPRRTCSLGFAQDSAARHGDPATSADAGRDGRPRGHGGRQPPTWRCPDCVSASDTGGVCRRGLGGKGGQAQRRFVHRAEPAGFDLARSEQQMLEGWARRGHLVVRARRDGSQCSRSHFRLWRACPCWSGLGGPAACASLVFSWRLQFWAVTGEAIGCGVEEDSWWARKARSRCVCPWNCGRRACAGFLHSLPRMIGSAPPS